MAEGDGESHHVPIVQAVLERSGSEVVGGLNVADVNVGAVAPRTEDNNGGFGVWDMVLTRP